MTEEEAIEYLKEISIDITGVHIEEVKEIILNLIDKLQKENSELQKENSELQEKIENLKMNIAINYTENSKLRHIVMSLPNGLDILEKL